MTPRSVCVDASLVLMLVFPTEHSAAAESLFSSWSKESVPLLCPHLLYAEVASVVRGAVYFDRITLEEGERAIQIFRSLGITPSAIPDLDVLAWELAKEFRRPRVYDSMYLAVAQGEGCELWTGDLRLTNAVNAPWVKWVGSD